MLDLKPLGCHRTHCAPPHRAIRPRRLVASLYRELPNHSPSRERTLDGRASLPQRSPGILSNHARAPAHHCHHRGGSPCGTRRAIGDEGNAYTAEFPKQPAQRVATRKPLAPVSRRARPPQRCTRERSSPRQCRIRAVPRSETPRWVTPPVPGLGGSRATTETPSLSHARRRDTTWHPSVANQPTGKPEVASMPLPL